MLNGKVLLQFGDGCLRRVAFVCRMLLNVMYTMVETLRCPDDNDSDEWKRLRDNFRAELSMWINPCNVLLALICHVEL